MKRFLIIVLIAAFATQAKAQQILGANENVASWRTKINTNSNDFFNSITTLGVTKANKNDTNIYLLTKYQSRLFLTTETDPVYNASAAKNITGANITDWNSKAAGNHNHIGVYQPVGSYLTGESDPVVKAVNGIVKSDGSTISAATSSDYVSPNDTIGGSGTKKLATTYQTAYKANFKDKIKYNDSAFIYVPDQVAFLGSMFIGSNSAGRYLAHNTGADGRTNLGIGLFTCTELTIGTNNTFISQRSGQLTTSGSFNTCIGPLSFNKNTTGSYNQSLGVSSLQNNTVGNFNLAFGTFALLNSTTGNSNIAIGGSRPLRNNTTGNNNIAIGDSALFNQTNQGKSIAIGHQAGYSNLVSERLYVENSNSQTPLIGGKFDLDQIGFNMLMTDTWKGSANVGGTLYVKNAIYQDLLSGSLTDGAPTAAQINTITGLTPSTATAGYKRQILDTDGTGLIYDITSDGTNWQYLARTKAI